MAQSNAYTRDLTQGREWQQILLFALPMMGANLLSVTYTLVDSLIVSNYVSASAFGAVSVGGPMIWVAMAIQNGMGAGAGILLAQYFGAGKKERIRSAAYTASVFGAALGLVMSAVWIALARPVLSGFLQVPADMYRDAWLYLVIYCAGFVFQMLGSVLAGVLRAFGNARASLWVLLVAAVTNLALDLLFVVGLQMGVAGAAIATVVSQLGAALVSLVLVQRYFPKSETQPQVRFNIQELRYLLELCIPVTLQMVISSASFLLLQRMVNSFGPASIEGFAAMGKTEEIIHIPVYAFSSALAGFTGQNIGAARIDRVKRGCAATMAMAVGVSILLGGLMFLFDENILRLFNITGDALLRGREHLDLMCILLPIFTVTRMASGTLQGAGDVRITVFSSFAEIAIRLALTYALSLTSVGFRSIYLSSPPAWIIACAIVLVRLLRGRWQQKALPSKT